MAGGKNRFTIPIAPDASGDSAPKRRTGPMGAAGREVGETLAAATEAQVEARRRNAADAKAWRAAEAEGRVLVRVPIDEIAVDDLPRDRLDLEGVAVSDEMEELKASIRAHGQKEPIELYVDRNGAKQLKKGWRRLTALRALHAETGDSRFAEAVCRVIADARDRVALYVDMVEENAVRENLTFAEMAQVVIAARDDPRCGFASYDEALGRLYGSLHRMKRSNIKQFVTLMHLLGDSLRWPKAIGRDLGANVGRALKGDRSLAGALRPRLVLAADAEEQNAILQSALTPAGDEQGRAAPKASRSDAAPKLVFRQGSVKVTARRGECRIKAPDDFASMSRARLEAAVAAFYAALGEGDA
jgi:ParB family chromosome partitioning protein